MRERHFFVKNYDRTIEFEEFIMTLFYITLILAASIFILVTVQSYQLASTGLQERIDVLEKREMNLQVSLEREKTRQNEFESMLSDLQKETRGLVTENDNCSNKLETVRQLEQELELQGQKAQFKRDQNRLGDLNR